MAYLRGIMIDGEWLGNNVKLDTMFHALCTVSLNIVKAFVLQVNTIPNLYKKIQIKEFGYVDDNNIHISFGNKQISGICYVSFKKQAEQMIIRDSKIVINRDLLLEDDVTVSIVEQETLADYESEIQHQEAESLEEMSEIQDVQEVIDVSENIDDINVEEDINNEDTLLENESEDIQENIATVDDIQEDNIQEDVVEMDEAQENYALENSDIQDVTEDETSEVEDNIEEQSEDNFQSEEADELEQLIEQEEQDDEVEIVEMCSVEDSTEDEQTESEVEEIIEAVEDEMVSDTEDNDDCLDIADAQELITEENIETEASEETSEEEILEENVEEITTSLPDIEENDVEDSETDIKEQLQEDLSDNNLNDDISQTYCENIEAQEIEPYEHYNEIKIDNSNVFIEAMSNICDVCQEIKDASFDMVDDKIADEIKLAEALKAEEIFETELDAIYADMYRPYDENNEEILQNQCIEEDLDENKNDDEEDVNIKDIDFTQASVDEVIEYFRRKKQQKSKKKKHLHFKILGGNNQGKAKILNNDLFLVGDKLYQWGDKLYLTE